MSSGLSVFMSLIIHKTLVKHLHATLGNQSIAKDEQSGTHFIRNRINTLINKLNIIMKVAKYFGLVALLLAVTIIGGVSGGGFLDFLFGKKKPGHGSSSSSSSNDYCSLPADPGPCRGAFEKWFWDAPAKLCNIFVYGGCAGNGNMFESWRECNNKCNKGSKPGGIVAW